MEINQHIDFWEFIRFASLGLFSTVISIMIVVQIKFLKKDGKDRLHCLAIVLLMPKIAIFLLGCWVVSRIIFKDEKRLDQNDKDKI